MHEAHTVFRVETTAKWNLHPNMPVNVPGGPVVGIIDPAHKDSPLTPEVVAEVVASGGLGVAGGTVFLTAGVGVVIVGVTAAVMYGFHAADEHQDNIRLSKTIEYLSSKPTFFISNAQNYGGSR